MKNSSRPLALTALVALALSLPRGNAALSAQNPTATDEPVNVLFILSDQHNAHMLGAEDNGYGGVTSSLTPNLDNLASEGVRFTNAFVAAPQCQPSRYTIYTGRWPHYHGVRWNGTWEPRFQSTFAELARDAGYRTASIGKDHMYWLDQSEPLLEDHGFDLIVDFKDYVFYCTQNNVPPYNAEGNFSSMDNLPGKIGAAGFSFNANEFHPTGYLADRVIDFIEESAADEAPFVCWYQMFTPHAPLLPSGPADSHDWAHLYHPFDALALAPSIDKVPTSTILEFLHDQYTSLSDDEWREILSYYYGLITQVDYNIGRVLRRLDELGLKDNTLVVYTSDHGEMGTEMGCWTKWNLHYDALSRIPLIMRLPGVTAQGAVTDALVSSIDYFPTMIELTGMPILDERRAAVDGVSLVDMLVTGTEPANWRDEVFTELGALGLPALRGPTRMVRTKEAKYTFDQLADEEELYDLVSDPWEIQNLATDPVHAPLLNDLRGRLDAWWNGAAGHVPHYQPNVPDTPASPPFRPGLPDDGATNVARDVDPEWLPSTASATQLVHFGTSSDPPFFAEVPHMQSSFNPGTLAAATTYYWRIGTSNDDGMALGPVWSFTTTSAGNGGPGLAVAPGPEHLAEGVPLFPRHTWTPAADATSQALWFGPPDSLSQVALLPQATGAFDLDRNMVQQAGVTYCWRIDSISSNGTTEGDVWCFETSSAGLPERATVIGPLHLSTQIAKSAGSKLSWTPGPCAVSHDVFFGTSFPLEYHGRQASSTFDPGPLQAGRTYFWRIDEINVYGRTTGWTWRFSAVQ